MIIDELDDHPRRIRRDHSRPSGRRHTQDDLTELGTALTSAPADHGKRTVFKMVGVAMQDWAIARLLADKFPC
ncbi:hypothetical protein [Streptomyces sp. V1I1]|uniref:hypothetical protein n=1 Tax=Streptomyces sp. V1I1 TaxID=3042272 RepID=UPI0027813812|nr:hypothetical protein [Streptomyces sp. V1I1]MDQ0945888.1 ornithine cyclodeaminase/alanine dehydrogenase-like protein (mu-crystallin family) [Streptomyces sp. V1I1]